MKLVWENHLKLFIGNIPGDALLVDIYEFLGGLQLRADFHARQGRDASNDRYHYVIAELRQPADLEQLIWKYDGMSFHGSSLAVRQYRERQALRHWQGDEKRINLH